MIRIELVANHSVEDNILESLKDHGVGKYYTRYPGVYGVGASGPRMGDAIWPEENFALVIWCEADEAFGIAKAVAAVKEHFPDEGIKLFGLPDPNAPQPAYAPPVYAPPAAAPVYAGALVDTPAPGIAPVPTAPVTPAAPQAAPGFGGEVF
jgi:hypothetical protein